MEACDRGHWGDPDSSEAGDSPRLKTKSTWNVVCGDNDNVDLYEQPTGEFGDSVANTEHMNINLSITEDKLIQKDPTYCESGTEISVGSSVAMSNAELVWQSSDQDVVLQTADSGAEVESLLDGEPQLTTGSASQLLYVKSDQTVPTAYNGNDSVGGENSAASDLQEAGSCEPFDIGSFTDEVPSEKDTFEEDDSVNNSKTNLIDNSLSTPVAVETLTGTYVSELVISGELVTELDCDMSPTPQCTKDISDIEQSGKEADTIPSVSGTVNRSVKQREPSLRERLGNLKDGIKSATKDNSHIMEAFGQMKQGIRSAISETSAFLEGPPSHRSRNEFIGGQVHSNNAKLNNTNVPDVAQKVLKDESLVNRDEVDTAVVDVGHGPGIITTDQTVDAHSDGAGDLNVVPVKGEIQDEDLLSQLDAELNELHLATDDEDQELDPVIGEVHSPTVTPEKPIPPPRPPPPLPNGLKCTFLLETPEFKKLKIKCDQLSGELQQKTEQNTRLLSVHESLDATLFQVRQQLEEHRKETQSLRSKATSGHTTIKALESSIASQNKELSETREKNVLLDKTARDEIAKVQAELKMRVEKLTGMNETSKREKADMVLKYARAEAKNIEMEQKMGKNDARTREMLKERDVVISKFKAIKADQIKCRELFESRSTEVVMLKRDLEKLKEQYVSQEGKTKWAHNKLRQEIDAHKETRAKWEDVQRKGKVARDEADQIRKDCQAVIKTYQESEEIKSNSLDLELKNKETELMQHKQEKMDHQEVHNMVRKELESFKMKHKEMYEELKTWRDKIQCLDAERIIQEQNLNKYRATLQAQKETNQNLQKRLMELEHIEDIVIDIRNKSGEVERRNGELEQECIEVRADMETCDTREQQHLEFTQKISDKNAHLQSENTMLSNKVNGMSAENDRLEMYCKSVTDRKVCLEKELSTERSLRAKENEDMTTRLSDKTTEVEKLTVNVDDANNELKTLKRKHAANTKDLSRQMQTLKRRVEQMESKDGSSMGSRTPSNGSLDTVNGRPANNANQPVVEPEPFVEIVEVDKQMLIDKIVRLQKAHARKNEKMEFMEDHIQQLFTEVQKKTKIIQSYALREEAGTIASDSADANKALLAKKGGIMASLYTSHQQDGAMNLDLSLDINRKLQAVLEDTLLKNITLKENIDTLGKEISRLSQENRAIQLSQQT